MAKKLIVGNWKMNLDSHQSSLLIQKLDQRVTAGSVDVVLCPGFVDLYMVAKEVNGDKFSLGAQNCHWADEGAYTGETSPVVLKKLVDYVIIGHSERRQYFNEDDKMIAKKVQAALRHGLKPIICVGENLDDRHHNLSARVVTDQLTAALNMVDKDDIAKVTVAYEPVWAIGTGEFAKPDQVEPVVRAIRHTIEELYGKNDVRVLYGGSVDQHNAAAYLKLLGVDGLLVGGASIIADQFAAIIKSAQSL